MPVLIRAKRALALLLCAAAVGCGQGPSEPGLTTISMAMWQGDPYINAYMSRFVAPRLAKDLRLELKLVGGQGAQLTAMLMTQIEAGQEASSIDMVWINGETFYQLRKIGALHGPFTQDLPNARFIDFDNPFIRFDFQQEIEGYEAPWGNVQLCLIYDERRVTAPPQSREELADWVRAHPGRFTFDNAFTGMTFLKGLLIDIAGGQAALDGPFDEAKYSQAAGRLWDYLNGIKKDFWKQGETYPTSVAQLHQLFAGGEVDFTMSNNDGEVDNKVLSGFFPPTARGYVPRWGTIQNTHYLGIVKRSAHVAEAMAAINFMISPEAQLEKLKPAVWGDGTVLAIDRLPPEWKERFTNVPGRRFAPPRSEIQPHALRELDPQYMIRLYEDFRRHVIE